MHRSACWRACMQCWSSAGLIYIRAVLCVVDTTLEERREGHDGEFSSVIRSLEGHIYRVNAAGLIMQCNVEAMKLFMREIPR
jgi:hypothetical protein